MLTTFEGDVDIQRALQAGARGYLLKTVPPKEIAEAIRLVNLGRKQISQAVANNLAQHMGDETLSAREIEVLREVANGIRQSLLTRTDRTP